MDSLRAEKIQPKWISAFIEIIENKVQKEIEITEKMQKIQKTDTESVRPINIPEENGA